VVVESYESITSFRKSERPADSGEFGLYTFEIYIDDRRARSLAIHVRDAADLEQEA
jgi:hypothetical protein